MKTTNLAGVILILVAGLLIIGGCSSTPPRVTDQQSQQPVSEIDKLIGVTEKEETKEQAPDEDEVLQLLGITKEKTEEPAVTESTKNEDQLRKDIEDLEKKLSEKNSEIAQLKSDVAKKDEKIGQLETDRLKQRSTPTDTYSSPGSFGEDYQKALAEYNNRNYKGAIQVFEDLLARNATSSLSDNCRYWIGESYYGLGNYNQAIIEFTKVFSFNNSDKIDDSQLKLGLCYWKLGDRERARQELERLINEYPKSEYIEKAQRFLSKL